MRIAAFQFKAGSDIEKNLAAIARGIADARARGVRIMVTQECALCGYPPVEREDIASIDFDEMNAARRRVERLARDAGMYVGLGTIAKSGGRHLNSVEMIAPNADMPAAYGKRALWGWDADNYAPGDASGIHEIDGVRIGTRICFEVRFPEYFRELFAAGAKIGFVSFCDVADEENAARYETIKAHLVTRAVENTMYVVSANSASKRQTAPTYVVSPDGAVIEELPRDREGLLVFDYDGVNETYGRAGRIETSRALLGMPSRYVESDEQPSMRGNR